MDTFKITLMLEPITEKPATEKQKREWSRKIGKAPHCELTLEELSGMVTDMHLSWCHALFEPGWIKRENFKQVQLLVLDVDDKLSPAKFMDRCRKHDLPLPNIIYRSMSDPTDDALPPQEKLKMCKKYRAVWALDQPVYDLKEYEKLLKKYMYVIFPEADALGATQKWLPGKEAVWFDEKPRLNVINLMCIADVWTARHCMTSRGKKKRFQKTQMPGILQNAVPKNASSLTIYKEVVENGTTNRISGFCWARAAEECRVFRDFMSKTRKITNPELFGFYSAGEELNVVRSCGVSWSRRMISSMTDIWQSQIGLTL